MNQQQPGTGSQQPLRQTHVVSCFLLRTDMDQPRILIVRRSQRVGSYNARWAGISGFLETGVRWIVPLEILDYETVPKLEEAYRSAADGEEVA